MLRCSQILSCICVDSISLFSVQQFLCLFVKSDISICVGFLLVCFCFVLWFHSLSSRVHMTRNEIEGGCDNRSV